MDQLNNQNHSFIYRSPEEYPPIAVNGKNPSYMRMLLFDYAGRNSEFTASNQYIYGSLILKNEYPEVSDVLLHIAIVEMHHLSLLGQIIIKLGGNPEFATVNTRGSQMFWDSGYVDYSRSIKKILLENLECERRAIAEYERHACMIKDEGIANMLKKIISDEQLHEKILIALYEEYCS